MLIRPPRAALAFAAVTALCLSVVAVGPASGVGSLSGTPAPPTPTAQAPTFGLVGTYRTDDDPDAAGGEVAALRGTRAYVINGTSIELVDVSDPSAPVKTGAVDLSAYGASVTSVAVGPVWVAASLPAADKKAPGTLVLFRHDGGNIRSTQVGALPDMVTFDSTGLRVLVANEGEPNSYGQPDSVDPVGSVSVVNALLLALGIPSNVRTIEFTDFNTGGPRAGELPAGVRIFGPGASVAQDLEPEYLTLDPVNPLRAFVTLQENNAVAELDLLRMRVRAIRALGSKDHSVAGNGFDASDRDLGVNIATWPVKGLYMPDSIASYRTNGSTYLVTTNEGDAREDDGFVEAVRVGSSSYVLDPAAYPNAAELKNNAALGRLNVTTATGKNAAGTAFDSITAFGGRSFTIWSSDGKQVWDSGAAARLLAVPEQPGLQRGAGRTGLRSGGDDVRQRRRERQRKAARPGLERDHRNRFFYQQTDADGAGTL